MPVPVSRIPLASLLLALPLAAGAADFVVDSTLDDGPGSLRAAIAQANAAPGADRILFAEALAGQTLSLQAPAPLIGDAVEIDGPVGGAAIVQGSGADRLLQIDAPAGTSVTLRDLVFRGGNAYDGGCIRVRRANLLLQRVRLSGCQATRGGGLASVDGAIAEIEDSRIDGNTASYAGGGLYALGPLFVGDSEIDHNRLEGPGYVGGGGVAAYAADLAPLVLIVGSHLHHNVAVTSTPEEAGSGSTGGALDSSRGMLRVENSSFYANEAGSGAAINRTGMSGEEQHARIVGSTIARNIGASALAVLVGDLYVGHSTISANRARPQGWNRAALDTWAVVPVRLFNSVVAGNEVGDVYSGGAPVEADYCYVGQAGAGSFDPSAPGTNVFGGAPLLGALRWNGGPTPTMRPLSGSPLIDRGTDADRPATDQRGYARLVGATVDIGSVEDDGDRLFDDAFEPGLAD